jgi:hypothetical protein
MKGMLLGIAVLLLLVFTAPDSQAQCQYCGSDFWTGCAACLDTSYNAWYVCSMSDLAPGFAACDESELCEGVLGAGRCGTKASPGCNVQYTEDRRVLGLPYRSGEWKLVSVTLKRKAGGGASL